MDIRRGTPLVARTPRRAAAGMTPSKRAPGPASEPVGVYCRLKPLFDCGDSDDFICARKVSEQELLLSPPETSQSYKSGHKNQTKCTFRKVFDNDADQSEIFQDLCVPLIDDLLRGKNGLLFAYGITGSGKTYTMIGNPGNGGMLPRSLDAIFNSIGHLQAERYVFKPNERNGMIIQNEFEAKMEQQRNKAASQKFGHDFPDFIRVPDSTKISGLDEDNVYAVFITFVEIYNNYIYDLLEETDPDEIHQKPPQSKNLREDHSRNMYVNGVNEYEVKSTEEAYELLWRGQQRRRVAQTQLNHESSRSHSVFTIRLVQAPVDATGAEVLNDKNSTTISQLSLVDLAGSERATRTQTTGGKLREAGNINAALMVLRQCMETLRDNQINGTSRIVPYRDSKLTHIFKNYFDGEGKVRMVVCISPSADEYDESLHVMRFAELTQEVEVPKAHLRPLENGLEPGRRNAHKLYKEAMEKLAEMEKKESGLSREATAPPPPPPPTSVPLPAFEPISFTFPHIAAPELQSSDDSTLLPSFYQALKEKQAMRRKFLEELELKKRQYRDYLGRIDGTFGEQRQALIDTREALDAKQREIQKTEKRAKAAEQKAMQEAVAAERGRAQQETERRINDVRQPLEAKIRYQEEKLRKMKEIVRQRRQEQPAPPPALQDPVLVGSQRQNPAVKSRHRKRSLSVDVWLEHKPQTNLQTDQVLQPKMKKKKTVNAPKIKDLKEGACSKYILAHQEQDSMGEVETQLFKGEVWKTRGGGAAVQFTDVEKLKSENPITADAHHRKSGGGKPAGGFSDDLSSSDESIDCPDADITDVQMRCAYAIEGKPGCAPAITHASPTKKKKK